MIKSLNKQGQLTPMVVSPKNSQFLMIDGFKRYQAAKVVAIKKALTPLTPFFSICTEFLNCLIKKVNSSYLTVLDSRTIRSGNVINISNLFL